ncbi:rho GDP-dissociation inhibitor 1 isoform X2 [Amborella trichopoda]|uniref:rho GDP-dissociation inhibitor 1 isoform X2 n=1 Tax=Amborella trichopoda TaxID=13333 RepID=UPI0009BFFE37|nr:rho GDP-dissociation inhibitor 1 isoform X2 [Amborella trichopoda]|eukprot:XP_020530965.1 rho GDP-dissociation inhibitor 1 isoform X2 [Amborella trichopoda]
MEESSSGSRRDAKIEKLASQLSLCDSEDDIEESKDDHFVLGPLLPLKQQLELDKDDESLRRWKEKLLGQVDTNLNVDESKGMLGTFAPQQEPYTHTLDEETTPSGVLARGVYSAKLKFEDDDKRCHLELDYSFEIKKSC